MKKVMLIAIMMMVVVGANAQRRKAASRTSSTVTSIQPKVGLNLAYVTYSGGSFQPGLLVGAEGEFRFQPRMSIAVGALYSMEGCADDGLHLHMDYINIPVVFNFYVVKGFAVKAGLQPAFNVRHTATLNGASMDISNAAMYVGGKVNTFNLSLPIGLSYEYKNFVADLRYHIGLTKLIQNYKGNNSTFSLTVGYKFTL